jgi:K+/H+ antiporter YhaU regulatory subunit KhtT
MRKVVVRHERLPKIGEVFEIDVASGHTVTVVARRSGRRDLSIAPRGSDEPIVTLAVGRSEALALAALLTGVQVEITTVPRS